MNEIVLKFFEPGHTFMAADSFHAAVEKAMRTAPPVTFEEFVDVVKIAKKKVDVLNMEATNFFKTTFNVTQYTLNQCKKRPYIDQIRRIIVTKGSLDLQYSSDVSGNGELHNCSLFSKKLLKRINGAGFTVDDSLETQENPIGVDASRKQSLLDVILPLIKEEQKSFWKYLVVKND